MLSRTRFLIVVGAALLTAVLIILFSPVLLSSGIKTWLWWKTRGTNVKVTIEGIESPFLRPIVLRGLRVLQIQRALQILRAVQARRQAEMALQIRTCGTE